MTWMEWRRKHITTYVWRRKPRVYPLPLYQTHCGRLIWLNIHDGTDTYPLVLWLLLRRKLQYSNIGLVAAWLQIESQTSLPFFAVNWSRDADSNSSKHQNTNPNWGGRREGSGRKKHAPMLPVTALPKAPCWHNRTSLSFFPHLCQCWQIQQVHTKQTQYQPVNSSTPARGFFAPRNCFQESRTRNDETTWTNEQGYRGSRRITRYVLF